MRPPVSFSRLMSSSSSAMTPNPLPAAFLRGGTSKGVFINRRHLPADSAAWPALFLRIMGSPDAQGRQLDGMGGGVSSLSKVMIVDASTRDGIDAEYTFAQVGIQDATVDFSGNCGNLTSMVGVFAVDDGICAARVSEGARTGTVRTWNTNTGKEIRTTFPVTPAGVPQLDLEQVSMAGVPGLASKILLDFVDPGGARTGQLLPTGHVVDSLALSDAEAVAASLVDATNPTVIVPSSSFFGSARLPPDSAYTDPATLARLEHVRRAGAEAMGLDPATQAQPKIAVVGVPEDTEKDVDVAVQALSMGVLHRAVPMTVGLCLGVAAALPGSVVQAIVRRRAGERQGGLVRLRHPSGIVDVGADFADDGRVASAQVVRTGRRLMQGAVWW